MGIWGSRTSRLQDIFLEHHYSHLVRFCLAWGLFISWTFGAWGVTKRCPAAQVFICKRRRPCQMDRQVLDDPPLDVYGLAGWLDGQPPFTQCWDDHEPIISWNLWHIVWYSLIMFDMPDDEDSWGRHGSFMSLLRIEWQFHENFLCRWQ